MDATTPVQQSTTGSTTPTNDPQQSTVSNGSGLQPQANSLQNAATQTVDGLNALDSGQSSISLSTVSTTSGTSTTTTVSRPYHLTINTVLYTGLVIIVVVFVASLFVGLFKPNVKPKTTPVEPVEKTPKAVKVTPKKPKSKKSKKGKKNGKKR